MYPANIHMLEKLAARTSPLLDQASQHPVGKFLLTQSRLKLVLHFAFFTTFSILGAVLIWPTFGGDYPPGVDTATFLHLSWVTKLAASGDLSNPFQDPYWYGGFPYLQAYPPLGYGLVGVISFITKIDLVNVYVALLVMAYGGLGLVTYWLAAEQGLSRWASALAAVLTMLAYPVLSSIILWGWFTSLMSLPFALIGFLLLQRSLRTGNWKLSVWGGIFMAVSIMIHHMTGISVGLGMAGWFLFHSTSRAYPIKQLLAYCSVFLAVTALVTAPWGIPFTIHVLDVGFRREVAGLWRPDLSTYSSNIIDSSLIGGFVYPSYLGITLLVLATGGTVFALIEARHLAGVAVALLVLVWFSMGVDLNPLIRVYPFTALDVARFHLFMVPFMTLLGAALVERLISFLKEIWPSLPPAFRSGRARYLWPSFVVSLIAAVLVFPAMDAWKARDHMNPYQVDGSVAEAIEWLAAVPPPEKDGSADRVYAVGLWNWHTFLIPFLAGRPLVDGWHDEGAPNVELVRPLRLMGWTGQVDAEESHRLLGDLGASYVLVKRIPDYPLESSQLFWEAFETHPQLYSKQQQWGDVAVFEVLP